MKHEKQCILPEETCAIFGQIRLDITSEVKEKTSKFLQKLIEENKIIYFLFGKIGPWEALCYDILQDLKKVFGHIKLIGFRFDGETSFSYKEFEVYEKMYTGIQPLPKKVYLFDEIYPCPVRAGVVFSSTSFDRTRRMFEHTNTVFIWHDGKTNEQHEWFEKHTFVDDGRLGPRFTVNLANFKNDLHSADIAFSYLKKVKRKTVINAAE